jgi:hypothetical protein
MKSQQEISQHRLDAIGRESGPDWRNQAVSRVYDC